MTCQFCLRGIRYSSLIGSICRDIDITEMENGRDGLPEVHLFCLVEAHDLEGFLN